MYDDPYAVKRLETYRKLMYLKSGDAILDIGCNVGEMRKYLPKNIKYYGVDIAYEDYDIKKIDLNYDKIPFNEKFDFILCTEILEHLYHPLNVIEQIPDLLKPDGIIIISLPNECTIFHRIMMLLGKGITSWDRNDDKHIFYPTIGQSRKFISKYFKIIKENYYINLSGKNSRLEWLGKLTSKIPDELAMGIAYLMPGLFARGVIFVCIKY